MTYQTNILLPVAVNTAFTYTSEYEVPVGSFVSVPFRGRQMIGVAWADAQEYLGKAKVINAVLDLPPLPATTRTFLKKVSDYTMTPLGNTLRLCFSPAFMEEKKVRKPLEIGIPDFSSQAITLSQEQTDAAVAISQAVKTQTYKTFLLDGVTGSGKTEVYLAAIQTALEQGQQALVLLPEIALTNQWLDRFQRRFGCAPLQWHSTLTESQRRQTWQAIIKGEAKVIVGARSALFLPYPNLGIIVIDEEHDGSFKQEEQVIYNARDMAVLRAHCESCTAVLVSATPALETIHNTQEGRYTQLVLHSRHGEASLPHVNTIDMRKQPRGWLSPPLIQALETTLAKGEQAILFLNRRGYAPLTLCHSCGHRFSCQNCSAWMVIHKRTGKFHCHHCGLEQEIPIHCPACHQSDTLIPCGPGVERVHEVVEKLLPQARCRILTSDEVTSLPKLNELVGQIHNHEIDILIGTQILAKGHHFPLITLVGVIDADLGLSGGDLRCAERTYQLLHQVSGRAGREERPGTVLLQTFQPDHPLMQAMVNQDRDSFNELELHERQSHGMPPFGRFISLTLAATNPDLVARTARHLGQTAPKYQGIELYGPTPAPLSFVRGKHRWRLLFKAPKTLPLQRILQKWLVTQAIPSSVQLMIDVDPYSFL
ncbi:MAG: primosomal protein N' [Candidatus Paracaedibacteraceae bacterium]|nr:primosomal protein N' [Candidatus Paracaedibacteraceae bacterium]